MKFKIILLFDVLTIFSCAHRIIISYPGLPSDFLDHKFDFYKKNQEDLFHQKDKQFMADMCKDLRNASFYKISNSLQEMSQTQKRSTLTKSDLVFERKQLKYVSATTKIDDRDHKINLFTCITYVYDEFIHLSYGFNENLMYIFKSPPPPEKGGKVIVEFLGLVESVPKLDGNIRNIKLMARIFLNTINNYNFYNPKNSRALNQDPLCTLNANQQFRLCSLVDSARSPSTAERVFKENAHSCLENEEVNLKIINKGEKSKYLIDRVWLNVIPCFDENNPAFYLTIDPTDEESVFSLIRAPRENEEDSPIEGKPVLIPDGRYLDITVLKYREEMY